MQIDGSSAWSDAALAFEQQEDAARFDDSEQLRRYRARRQRLTGVEIGNK
jgi:hypothetical protein